MRTIIVDTLTPPAGAPQLTASLTANETAIYAAAPSLWLEGTTDWITTSGGSFSAWTCRATGQGYVPALSAPPLLPAVHAGRQAVRFGFGASGYSVSSNGVLRPRSAAFRAFPASAKFTLVALIRAPVPSAEGGTELTGNSGGDWIDSASLTESERARWQYGYGNGNMSGAAKNGTTALAYSSAADDGVWRMIVHSQDASPLTTGEFNGALRVDGVEQTHYSGTLSAPSTTDNASVTASVSAGGQVMTISAVASGTVKVGQTVFATGIVPGTRIASLGTSTGGTGTVNLDTPAIGAVTDAAVTLDGGARTLTIGGGGSSYTQQRFVGDIGGVLLIPNVAAHRDAALLAAIEGHFGSALTALKS